MGKDAPVNDRWQHPVLPRSPDLPRRSDFGREKEDGSARSGDATEDEAGRLRQAQGIKLHGELKDRKGSEGICHSVMLETYALPGQLNVGSDSHTPHVGAIGCVAFGIGTTDVFNSWITKDVRVKVPESVKIVIRGKKQPNVTAKDFILKILSLEYVRSGKALAKVMEYSGEAIEALSVDERATMTNMAAEIGGFTGIVAPDREGGGIPGASGGA